jgi:hypothetical protein
VPSGFRLACPSIKITKKRWRVAGRVSGVTRLLTAVGPRVVRMAFSIGVTACQQELPVNLSTPQSTPHNEDQLHRKSL